MGFSSKNTMSAMSVDLQLTKYTGHKEYATPHLFRELKQIGDTLPTTKSEIKTTSGGCTLTMLRNGTIIMVQTTEMLYPVIDDPYIMGRIACSRVLSDIYSFGITDIENILMFFGLSTKLPEKEKDTIAKLIFKGFRDQARIAGTEVLGGQTVFNPWITLGGSATSICNSNDIIMPSNAGTGDVLILTKPLGSEVAVMAYQLLNNPKKASKMLSCVDEQIIHNAYNMAIQSMTRLNRSAAFLMKKYCAKGAVTVAERGLVGHAQDLAAIQDSSVNFHLYSFPMIANMNMINETLNCPFDIKSGRLSEINGGLLIVISGENANRFCNDMLINEGYRPWIIGVVAIGERKAFLENSFHITEVENINAIDNWTGGGAIN